MDTRRNEVNEDHKGNEKIPCRHRAQGRAEDDAQKAGAFETHIETAPAGWAKGGIMTPMDWQLIILLAPTLGLVVYGVVSQKTGGTQ